MRHVPRSLAVLVAWAVAVPVPTFGQEQGDDGIMHTHATAEHRHLAAEVGTWDATITAHMGGPGAPPSVSRGVETNRMMGDLWLISDFEGDFGGMPFRGHSIIGFEPKAGHYVMSWADTMNPRLATHTGSYDPEAKTLTFVGKAFDPMLDKQVEQKTTSTLVDEGRKRFALYMKAPEYGDDWVKFMEIDYTRRAE